MWWFTTADGTSLSKLDFAKTVANDGAIPLVQLNPTHASVAAIAAGRYDGYLTAYAESIRSYHRPVILSFGHEMNGYWYKWGYTHTSPTDFRSRLASHR